MSSMTDTTTTNNKKWNWWHDEFSQFQKINSWEPFEHFKLWLTVMAEVYAGNITLPTDEVRVSIDIIDGASFIWYKDLKTAENITYRMRIKGMFDIDEIRKLEPKNLFIGLQKWIDFMEQKCFPKDSEWCWMKNMRCKYIRFKFIISKKQWYAYDDKMNPIKFKDLTYQIDTKKIEEEMRDYLKRGECTWHRE